jgi:hypothetical protein
MATGARVGGRARGTSQGAAKAGGGLPSSPCMHFAGCIQDAPSRPARSEWIRRGSRSRQQIHPDSHWRFTVECLIARRSPGKHSRRCLTCASVRAPNLCLLLARRERCSGTSFSCIPARLSSTPMTTISLHARRCKAGRIQAILINSSASSLNASSCFGAGINPLFATTNATPAASSPL